MTDSEPAAVADDRNDLPFMVHSELDDLDLDPFEFRAYAHMVRRAGRQGGRGEHWESVDESAKHCRMDPKTYRRALQGLVERRLVTREDRPGQTSVYRLTSPKAWRPLPQTVGVQPSTPTENGRGTTSGRGAEKGRGTPTKSGRTPLPKTVDKGSPKKGVPGRESQETSTRAKPEAAKKPTAFDPRTISLPEFVSPDVWEDFVKYRAGRKRPLTEQGAKLILAKLAKTPLDADEMLRNAIERTWTGVFPLDGDKRSSKSNGKSGSSVLDQYREKGL